MIPVIRINGDCRMRTYFSVFTIRYSVCDTVPCFAQIVCAEYAAAVRYNHQCVRICGMNHNPVYSTCIRLLLYGTEISRIAFALHTVLRCIWYFRVIRLQLFCVKAAYRFHCFTIISRIYKLIYGVVTRCVAESRKPLLGIHTIFARATNVIAVRLYVTVHDICYLLRKPTVPCKFDIHLIVQQIFFLDLFISRIR